MFKAAIDRLGGSVAAAGSVEVGKQVGGASLEGATEGDQFGQRFGDVVADGVDGSA